MFHSIAKFYLDGFRSMQVGRSLWKIIILKLIIMFTILKLFFPNFLQLNYDNDQERADHVLRQLTRSEAPTSWQSHHLSNQD